MDIVSKIKSAQNKDVLRNLFHIVEKELDTAFDANDTCGIEYYGYCLDLIQVRMAQLGIDEQDPVSEVDYTEVGC